MRNLKQCIPLLALPGRIIILVLFILLPTLAKAQSTQLIDFEMHDQFDRVYTNQDYAGKVLVVVEGDRKGSEYTDNWGIAIGKVLKDNNLYNQSSIIGIANLYGVPDFLKNKVKRKFPDKKEKWVLMDWQGIFASTYNFKDDVANICVFNPNGKLVYQTTATEISKQKLVDILEVTKRNYP